MSEIMKITGIVTTYEVADRTVFKLKLDERVHELDDIALQMWDHCKLTRGLFPYSGRDQKEISRIIYLKTMLLLAHNCILIIESDWYLNE